MIYLKEDDKQAIVLQIEIYLEICVAKAESSFLGNIFCRSLISKISQPLVSHSREI